MKEIGQYIAGLDFSPLLISLKTGVVATVFSFFLGIFTAQKVVRANTRGKSHCRWHSDTSYGTSAYCGRFFPVADIQSETTFWCILI